MLQLVTSNQSETETLTRGRSRSIFGPESKRAFENIRPENHFKQKIKRKPYVLKMFDMCPGKHYCNPCHIVEVKCWRRSEGSTYAPLF